MIYSKEISQEENVRLNGYISALSGIPKLVDCEKLFEFLRILRANYGTAVQKFVNKINIKILRPAITFIWTKSKFTLEYRNRAFDLSRKSLLFSARDDFDSFMLYTEIDRPTADKFWQPRRNSKMREACEALQELADDKIDVLFMAEPPRVGKTTLGLWFDAWYAAKAAVENWSEQSILAVGHSASLVATFYEEIGQFVEGDKYKFLEVFPELRERISYSAKHQTINFGDERRYKSLSFRSADGSLAGGVEAGLLLHIDDLIANMEEAMNPDRLEKKWVTLYGDIRQRRKEGSKILYIGTIWSLMDPQVRFRDLLAEDPNYRIKIIELPALDENDESNFDFKGGFSTAHYAYEFIKMQKNGKTKLKRLLPFKTSMVFSEDDEDEVVFAYNFYERLNEKGEKIGLHFKTYTPALCFEFDTSTSCELEGEVKEVTNPIGIIPIVMYPNNDELMGDFEPAIPILDAINKTYSNRIDNIDDIVEAFLVFVNTEIFEQKTDENGKVTYDNTKLKTMKKNKAIEIRGEQGLPADVKHVVNKLDQKNIQIVCDNLVRLAYVVMGVPDGVNSKSSGGSDSAEADKTMEGFEQFEQLLNDKERLFKKSIKLRLAIIRELHKLDTATDLSKLEPENVDIRFIRSKSLNGSSVAVIIQTLRKTGLFSPDTLIALSNLCESPQEEIDKITGNFKKLLDEGKITQLQYNMLVVAFYCPNVDLATIFPNVAQDNGSGEGGNNE